MNRRAVAIISSVVICATTPGAGAVDAQAPSSDHDRPGVIQQPQQLRATTAERRFLGKSPIGPLALVHHGALVPVPRRACRTWGHVGSRWLELDEYGRVVGEVEVFHMEHYYLSRCDELSVRLVHGRLGAGVRVSVDSGYFEPDYSSYQPRPEERKALARDVAARQTGIVPEWPVEREVVVPFSRRVLYFTNTAGDHWAAVGGKTLVVARWNGSRWIREYEQLNPTRDLTERAFLPFAVTDMNGDGQPEVVVRREEGMGEFYGDFVVSRSKQGQWQDRGWGIFGSTA